MVTRRRPNVTFWVYRLSCSHLTSTQFDKDTVQYLLTAWCRVLPEKLTGLQLVKKFPAFYGTRRFITALTSVRHLSLSWVSPIQSTYPHPTSWRSILILSTHLSLGLPSGLLPFGFPTKTLYAPLTSPIRATCPAHLILLDFITRIILGEEYRSFSSSLCNLLHSPFTSSLLGPNIKIALFIIKWLESFCCYNSYEVLCGGHIYSLYVDAVFILARYLLSLNELFKKFCE